MIDINKKYIDEYGIERPLILKFYYNQLNKKRRQNKLNKIVSKGTPIFNDSLIYNNCIQLDYSNILVTNENDFNNEHNKDSYNNGTQLDMHNLNIPDVKETYQYSKKYRFKKRYKHKKISLEPNNSLNTYTNSVFKNYCVLL